MERIRDNSGDVRKAERVIAALSGINQMVFPPSTYEDDFYEDEVPLQAPHSTTET